MKNQVDASASTTGIDWIVRKTLDREQVRAETTLGRQLVDPKQFAITCITEGLGAALNHEQDLVDLLPSDRGSV